MEDDYNDQLTSEDPAEGSSAGISQGNIDDAMGDDGDGGDGQVPRVNRFDASAVHHLSGMYRSWFLDYASYVILERAVPHIEDGLKPVQRRILHSMRRIDDGRYNKVANIVGHTMQFHPHGDASIGDALVQIGQKELLVDTQGNWGNILTGDRAAAPRYIEARLSKFALEVVFNPKTTEWQLSYDGRNREPITLPAKFPLLLAQGAEGIAVGLSSKVLPHNFNEICDAAVHYLHGEPFTLYPDFPTGGSIDVSRYNDGQRGGVLKVRAKIEKIDAKTLAIREIPYGKTTSTLIDTILKAIEKGKIKARKVDDNTAAQVEILVHLAPGVSSDKTIDALYAFSDCEVNISPNCCVIVNEQPGLVPPGPARPPANDDTLPVRRRPEFLTVSDVLRVSVDRTKELLRRELLIRRGELMEQLHFWTLERIFIEERIYKDEQFEQAKTKDAACEHIDLRLTPWYPRMIREVTKDDILKLLDIRMERILKYSKDKADKLIAQTKREIAQIDRDLAHMTEVTARWFTHLKETYGAQRPRLTEIKNFDTIEAAKVAEANEKLYINRQDGFIGTGLKKDEFVCNCSDIDDIIVFHRDGKYRVVRVADKIFVGKNILHVGVFKRNDQRMTYNAVYRDGRQGAFYIKRFNITSVQRDKDYDLTQGKPGSRVAYFTANANGEAEVIKVTLDAQGRRPGSVFMEKDFATILIKSRSAQGVILTKKNISRISMKSRGHSTLGGRKVWFDTDIHRLNYDGRGMLLGEFNEGDSILVMLGSGNYYTTNFDTNNHYEDNIVRIEKYDGGKVWTAVVRDAGQQGYLYLKRFTAELSAKKQSFIGDDDKSELVMLTDTQHPRLSITFGGADAVRGDMEVDAASFVAVKGFRAKGKRLTTYTVAGIEELEPLRDETDDIVPTQDLDTSTDNDGETMSATEDGPSTGNDDASVSPPGQQSGGRAKQQDLFPDLFPDTIN